MLNLKDIKNYHKFHNELQEVIHQIIEFINEINGKDDEVECIKATDRGFEVSVHEWSGGGFYDSEDIVIDFDLLLKGEAFNKLEQQANEAKSKRERLKREREMEYTNKEIERAMKLLKEHGKI